MKTVEGVRPIRLNKSKSKTGAGIVNTLINKLPIELHLPGYQYCGPGTKLEKRLTRGDKGINPLDSACRNHDIAYSNSIDIRDRHRADYELEQRAWERFKSSDSSFGEKTAAWLVTNTMKVKRKVGMGVQRINDKSDKLRKVTFRSGVVRKVRESLSNPTSKRLLKTNTKKAVSDAVKIARMVLKKSGGRRKIRIPRIIPIPKSGGILPLIPILAGLSALGSLAGGTAGIIKAINSTKSAGKQLDEANRHNKMMESIALGKKGSGLHLKPYRSGLGIYLNSTEKPKN